MAREPRLAVGAGGMPDIPDTCWIDEILKEPRHESVVGQPSARDSAKIVVQQ